MKEGKSYKMFFADGTIAEAELLEDRDIDGLFKYLESTPSKPIATLEHEEENCFHLPFFIFEYSNNRYEEI